jgi:large subunit ribosomal protein L15
VDQHTLRQPAGAKRPRKRIGRGDSSGQGGYAGRGLKGQKSRAGGGVRPGFEGGQIPITRRLGRLRGFKNYFRTEFQAINLQDLERRFEAGATVDGATLFAARLLEDANEPFKVLGGGALTHALTVRAPRLSDSAKEAITAVGGTFEELAPAEKKVRNRIHRRREAEQATPAPQAQAE